MSVKVSEFEVCEIVVAVVVVGAHDVLSLKEMLSIMGRSYQAQRKMSWWQDRR